jgi:hypothetical protein
MSFLYWRTNLTRSLLAGSVYYLGASAGNTHLYFLAVAAMARGGDWGNKHLIYTTTRCTMAT